MLHYQDNQVRGRNSKFLHYLLETGYVQFQNRTKLVTHILMYTFLSNLLVDYLYKLFQ